MPPGPKRFDPDPSYNASVAKTVDSYRFLSYLTRKLVRAWIALEPQREIPWTPLAKPLRDSTVALVSTAGVALADDVPFDQEGERRNPWWGDPSFRVLPRDTSGTDVRLYHLHIDNRYAEQDLDCALPLTRLAELEKAGEIGSSAPSHYSLMGYILEPEVLLERSTPEMIRRLQDDRVDLVLLAPY